MYTLSWKGCAAVSIPEYMPFISIGKLTRWQQYLLDSLLATTGTLCVTGLIFVLQLYPRIHNISVVYLLVILWLASTRGRYAAILASLVAFLSFDFFIIPPLYTFVIYQPEEWIALFVFLVAAILTSQLAVALRERAEQAAQRERETRILYDLVRETNREEDTGRQLQAIVQTIVSAFSTWGVYDCAILQPDAQGVLQIRGTVQQQSAAQSTLSADEQAIAARVIASGRAISRDNDTPYIQATTTHVRHSLLLPHYSQRRPNKRSLHLIPLKIGQQIVGVLLLRVQGAADYLAQEEQLKRELEKFVGRTTFFWTFLDQVAFLVERARLHDEHLRIDILQRTDALRAALLSSVSHDLRTPLTTIKAAASSLLQDDVRWDDEMRHGFATSIERETDRLNRLVGNLLDMSRIEGGALKLEKEWYSPQALIQDVLDRLRPSLRGHPVTIQLPADLPPIELDYLLMDQVLTNLLENAVRYTPMCSAIEVCAQRQGEQIIISVADHGPGIPASELERIFDKFYRVLGDQRTTGNQSGTGLGLAVCRGFVEAHGGQIWAEAGPAGGAIFHVALPVGVFERSLT